MRNWVIRSGQQQDLSPQQQFRGPSTAPQASSAPPEGPSRLFTQPPHHSPPPNPAPNRIPPPSSGPAHALHHELRNEARDGSLAYLSCRSRAPRHSQTTPFSFSATATSPGLLRGSSSPEFLCYPAAIDSCATLSLELGEACVEGECVVGRVGWERDLCRWAEKQAVVH